MKLGHDTFSRLLRGTAVVFAGNAGSALLGFVVFVVLARSLQPAAFGALAPMISILDMGQIFMDMIIGGGTLLFASRYVKTDPPRADMAFKIAFWTRVVLALAVAIIGCMTAPWLSQVLFDSTAWAAPLRLAFIGLVGLAVYTACIAVLQARQQFFLLASVILYKNVLRLAGVGLILLLGLLSVSSAVWLFSVSLIVAALLALAVSPPTYLKTPGFDSGIARELIQANGWMFLLLLVLVAGSRLDVFMLTALSSAEEVGHYSAALQLSSVVAILGQSLMTTLFPEVASFKDADRIRRYARRYLTLVPLALVPAVLIVAVSPWLIPLLLGNQYAASASVFSLLLLLAFITMLSNPLLMTLFPLGQVRLLLVANLIQVIARVLLNLAVMPAFGAQGAALVDLITKIAMVTITVSYVLWRVSRPPSTTEEVS